MTAPKCKKTLQFVKMVNKEYGFIWDEKNGTNFPYIGKLNETDTIKTILDKVLQRGIERGRREGRSELQWEIKNTFKDLLNITKEDME